MNDNQVYEILKIIKSNYQTFRIEEDVVSEWFRRLKDYDYKEVRYKLEDYLSYGEEYPRINQLINGLKKIDEKGQKLEGIFICKKCGRHYDDIIDMDRCYERDMDIEYIWKMSEKFNINANEYFRPSLSKATLEEINRGYNNFILRIIEEEKKEPKLTESEKKGIKGYYNNVIRGGNRK